MELKTKCFECYVVFNNAFLVLPSSRKNFKCCNKQVKFFSQSIFKNINSQTIKYPVIIFFVNFKLIIHCGIL